MARRCKLASYQQLPEGGAYCFAYADPQIVGADIADFFLLQGYRMESGHLMMSNWGKGSDVARAFLGGFVDRFLFTVQINPQPPYIWVSITKAMSGMMGGVIGYAKMNTEVQRIVMSAYQFWV